MKTFLLSGLLWSGLYTGFTNVNLVEGPIQLKPNWTVTTGASYGRFSGIIQGGLPVTTGKNPFFLIGIDFKLL